MSSNAQINANRLNSQSSTGPTTPEGKRKSSMNSIKHVFAGHTCIIQAHEAEAFFNHFQSFREEYRPVGPTEEFLVQSLADLSWSTQQIRAQIHNRIVLAGNGRSVAITNETFTPEIETAISQARYVEDLASSLNLLGTYEQRKMRLFNSTLKQLTELQATRKAKEQEELAEAARLRQADKATRQPEEPEWLPEENGFVCSLEEIDLYIARQQRLHRLNNHLKHAA